MLRIYNPAKAEEARLEFERGFDEAYAQGEGALDAFLAANSDAGKLASKPACPLCKAEFTADDMVQKEDEPLPKRTKYEPRATLLEETEIEVLFVKNPTDPIKSTALDIQLREIGYLKRQIRITQESLNSLPPAVYADDYFSAKKRQYKDMLAFYNAKLAEIDSEAAFNSIVLTITTAREAEARAAVVPPAPPVIPPAAVEDDDEFIDF